MGGARVAAALFGAHQACRKQISIDFPEITISNLKLSRCAFFISKLSDDIGF
jgi:hypothetical protein